MINTTLLRSLVGRRVAIHTNTGQSGYKDEGVIRTVDDQVIVLEGKNQEGLYFVIHNIRLIKVLE